MWISLTGLFAIYFYPFKYVVALFDSDLQKARVQRMEKVKKISQINVCIYCVSL